jgi:hypothetical protein
MRFRYPCTAHVCFRGANRTYRLHLICPQSVILAFRLPRRLGDLYDDAAAQALMDNVVLGLVSLHGHLTRRAWFRRFVASRRFHRRCRVVLRLPALN